MSRSELFTCDGSKYHYSGSGTTTDPAKEGWFVCDSAMSEPYGLRITVQSARGDYSEWSHHFCSWDCFESWAEKILTMPPEPEPQPTGPATTGPAA